MDNLEEKLEITKDTTKDEIIGYCVRLYEERKPEDLTEDEVIKYAGNTWQHSKSVHFYLDKLGISIDDESETPHDLVGSGNKLEWEVMHGLAYAEKDTPEKKKIFEKSLEIHRRQMHHQMWNDPKSPEEWLKYGAIDAVCSLLEPRLYQEGVHYWDEILDVISSCPNEEYKKEKHKKEKHKKEKMIWAVEEMKKVTPLLKNLEIWISSLLQENKKNSKENNNSK